MIDTARLILGAAAVLFAAACSGDDTATSTPSPSPSASVNAADLPILDPWELHVAASDGSGDKTLLSTTAGIFHAWSPDGDEVAVAESTYLKSTVRFVGLDGAVRTSVTHDGSAGDLSWSPDRKYVVSRFTISGGDAIVAVPSDGSSAKEVVTATPSATHPGSLFASGWLPSGELLVDQNLSGGAQTDLIAYNIDAGTSRKLTDLNAWVDYFGEPRLTPDKTKLLVWATVPAAGSESPCFQSTPVAIWTIDLATDASARLTPDTYCGSGGMAWSPDDKQLAFSVIDGTAGEVYVFDTETQQARQVTSDGLDEVVAWNTDGTIIAQRLFCNGCDGGGEPRIVKIDVASGAEQVLTDGAAAALAPTGDTVAVGDAGVRRIDLSGQLGSQLAPATDGWRYASMSWSSDEKHVAYVRLHEQGERIFSINRDGSGFEQTGFFSGAGDAGTPMSLQLSPDGTRVAYWVQVEAGKGQTLWIADADGSGAQKVDVAGNVGGFSWSPDSKRIIFSVINSDASDVTYMVNADGSGLRQVTTQAGFEKGGGAMIWAPNNKLVVFPGAPMLVLEVDTGDLLQVTPGTVKGIPTWSADSTKLVYPVFNSQNGSDILVSAIDGSVTTTISGDNRSLGGLTVSPDGTKMVYLVASGDTGGLYIANIDGTDARLFLAGGSLGAGPAWSPDGQWIAAMATQDGPEGGLFVVRPDGSDARQLTRGLTIASIAWDGNDRLRLMSYLGGL